MFLVFSLIARLILDRLFIVVLALLILIAGVAVVLMIVSIVLTILSIIVVMEDSLPLIEPFELFDCLLSLNFIVVHEFRMIERNVREHFVQSL